MSVTIRGAIARVGVDLAKRVIQGHAVDANGRDAGSREIRPMVCPTACRLRGRNGILQ